MLPLLMKSLISCKNSDFPLLLYITGADTNHIFCLIVNIVLKSLFILQDALINQKHLTMTRSEMYYISREIRPSPGGSKNICSKSYFIHREKVNKNKSDWHYQ